MCQAITCTTCGRTTWAGCGKHVDQVMATVPDSQRCPGHPSTLRPAQPISAQPNEQGVPARRTFRLFARRSR